MSQLERLAIETASDEGNDVPSGGAHRPAGASAPPRIVVVGGGAAGLELVTRLGDRLGRRGRATITLVDRARIHLWKPLLYEVAAGSVDPGEYEVNYLAQAHWHGFRYRLGEIIGLDRAAKRVHLAATFDDEGRQITPLCTIAYDTFVIAIAGGFRRPRRRARPKAGSRLTARAAPAVSKAFHSSAVFGSTLRFALIGS